MAQGRHLVQERRKGVKVRNDKIAEVNILGVLRIRSSFKDNVNSFRSSPIRVCLISILILITRAVEIVRQVGDIFQHLVR